jgi:N-methylhydantoinase A
MDARGTVIAELDERDLRVRLRELISQAKIETLCVSLMHAYANPEHEQRVRELAHEIAPTVPVTLSSEVLPEPGEYERTLTTTVEAWVGPRVNDYLDGLQTRLSDEHVASSKCPSQALAVKACGCRRRTPSERDARPHSTRRPAAGRAQC